MIPRELLALTKDRASTFCTYGPPGCRKTLAAITLPPPIQIHDFEGGTGTLMPWIRRSKNSNEMKWTEVTDAQRQQAWDLLDPSLKTISPISMPQPLVDVIAYDSTNKDSYNDLVMHVTAFNPSEYDSLVLDPLQEFSYDLQTAKKGQNNLPVTAAMEGKLWGGVQDNAGGIFRLMRNYNQRGVVLYMTSGMKVDKDYVTDPREQKAGEKEKPYSVKGSIWIPGGMVDTITHGIDCLFHSSHRRIMLPDGSLVNQTIWNTKPVPFVGGSNVYWDAKDRWGRLKAEVPANFMTIFSQLYGPAGARAIYSHRGAAPASRETPVSEVAV